MKDSLSPNFHRGDPYDLIELHQLLQGPHRVIFEGKSPFQEVLLIETKKIRLYSNHQLEFNSLDETIYHEALVHPAMLLTEGKERVLIIGGENGLALREVLKYSNVGHVSLIPNTFDTLQVVKQINEMTELNEEALFDKRVEIINGTIHDAINNIDKLYHTIILDLPEPSNEEYSHLYTEEFYKQLLQLLTDDGIIVCQGNSIEDTPLVFWSIGQTLSHAGFHPLSYHVHIPWFGDWGFHLAGKKPITWDGKLRVTVKHRSLLDSMSSWFQFPDEIQKLQNQAVINSLDCLILHKFFATGEIDTIPDNGQSIFYEINHLTSDQLIDKRESNELKNLLSGPHRILYEGEIDGNHVLIVETKDVRLYLDKQLQFSSLDERIYHEALVHPALALAPEKEKILIVGGGDGFAVREVAKYSDVQKIDLVDLDPLVLHVAKDVQEVAELNEYAMFDERLSVYQEDIRTFIEDQPDLYDVIIVDLPDPAEEEISRLYTVEFFNQLTKLLSKDGILACQSHSPEYAPLLFWSIGATIKGSGLQIYSYSVDVPSFGEWGFHLAGNQPLIWKNESISVPNQTLPEDMFPFFNFPLESRSIWSQSQVNTLNDLKLHELYIRKDVNQNL
jgi:predicted membrane-bound spermidine synthase